MATTAPQKTTTVSFTEPEMAALRALLYSVQEPESLADMNRAYALGLGSNHIETLTGLHAALTAATR